MDDTTHDDQHDETGEEAEVDTSLLAGLKGKRRQAVEEREGLLDLKPSAYDGELVLRFGYRDVDRMTAVGRKVAKLPKRLRVKYAAADALHAALEEVCLRMPSGELRRIAHGFDAELAGVLDIDIAGVPPSDIHRVVAFATFERDHEVILFGQQLSRWLQTGAKEVDDEFMGE